MSTNQTKALIKALSTKTNAEIWNLDRQYDAKFKSITSEATSELFTERGFNALKSNQIQILNEYWQTTIRFVFQLITIAEVRNIFETTGVVEHYNTPNGGMVQRMAIETIKAVSPKFYLKDGVSVDQQVVRKPKLTERFFQQNYDYQNWITKEEYELKKIFLDEYGVGNTIAGLMIGLNNSRELQNCMMIYEIINGILNNDTYPLQDSQIMNIKVSDKDNLTNEDLTKCILTMKNTLSSINCLSQSGQYNAAGFETVTNSSDYVLLVKPGFKNLVSVNLMTGAYNPENLSIDVEQLEVPNFGGLKPYKEAAFTTELSVDYDENGATTGKYYDPAAPTVKIENKDVFWKDPNADTIAVLIQKGTIFVNEQNPYQVMPAPYNSAGLYINLWASSRNNAICYDPYYSVVQFKVSNAT